MPTPDERAVAWLEATETMMVGVLTPEMLNHTRRIVAQFTDYDARIVAWLHHWRTDTDLTLADFADLGYGRRIVNALNAMSYESLNPLTARVRRACQVESVDADGIPRRLW